MAKVRFESATSSSTSPEQAAEETLTTLGSFPAKVVFGFIPGPFDHRAYHQALHERLPKDTHLVTSSTGGELTTGGYLTNHLVLGALGGDLDVGIGWGTGLSRDAAHAGSSAIDRAAKSLGMKVADLDRHYGAVVIDDGLKMKKEEMLLGVLEKNQGLVLVGGGASSYEFMQGEGWMGVDGEVFTDGTVTALFKTLAPWAALRSHAYEPTGQRVRVTKFDSETRRILEFDGKPAGARWCELANLPPENLHLTHMDHMKWALAMKVGREYFLRAVVHAADADAVESTSLLQEDQELEVVTVGNIVESTRRFFREEVPRRVRNPSAALLFDCGARRFYAMMHGKLDELGTVLSSAPPSAGFTVSFETYCGFMISSTLTSLVFGSNE
jgi:hypothetical protein